MSSIEIDGSSDAYIEWSHPEIYDRSKQTTLLIAIDHVRAADPIRIKYDGERDGWVIEQQAGIDRDGVIETENPERWVEAAFVRSWQFVTEQEKP